MGSTPARRDERLPADYADLLADIKARVAAARAQAALAVSATLLAAYWEIGSTILAREGSEGWGTRFVERLAADLRREFPA